MRQLARDLRTFSVALIVGATAVAAAPVEVVFPTEDGGEIHAHLYGAGDRAVVLAHGKVFDKESWQPLAERLASAGLQVLALDFRGYGRSQPGSAGNAIDLDVLGAVAYLESQGVSQISLLGASMGGWAVGSAATRCRPGQIQQVVLLAPAPIERPEAMQAESFVYIVSQGERGFERVEEQFERAPEPKRLEVLAGEAHAQHVFKTDQSEDLMNAILGAIAGD
jgi:pimeloyl-ACP methyl ester carboxylesterase